MSSYTFRSSRPDQWTQPRPHSDASLRFMAYGPIQPMVGGARGGLLSRLFAVT